MYKKITIISFVTLAASFNVYGEFTDSTGTEESKITLHSSVQGSQGEVGSNESAPEVSQTNVVIETTSIVQPQLVADEQTSEVQVSSSEPPAAELQTEPSTSPAPISQTPPPQAKEATAPKNSYSLELKLLPGETKINTLVLDLVMNKDKITTRMLLKTKVFYQVIGIDYQGNYLIAARPFSIELSHKTSDKAVIEATTKKTYSPYSIAKNWIPDQGFTMVVSPKGTLVELQNKDKLKHEIKEIIASSTTKTNIRNVNAADVALGAIEPVMANLISITLFSYPEHPIAIGQGWESNGMTSPVWKDFLNPAYLVYNQENVSLGKPTRDMKQLRIFNSNQIYVVNEKLEYRAHGTTTTAYIDEKTHWLKKAEGDWLITAHAADKKGQKKQQPKEIFAIRAKISIQ